ncbi:MAG: mannitol dehydrogenase family protein [Rhodobacteraceae bacterium]|nr:mannitol dehydrogenase family protein [Paracoccaceae bacterium]
MPVRLSNAALGKLSKGVVVPLYDRSRLTPGIVHIGLGNFHRAHQAWYLHRLMQEGHAFDWGIIGAGVRVYDREQRRKLEAQDFLTTLIELDPGATSAEIIGSIIGYVPVEEENGPLIRQMADSAIRIVQLTVTEGGYFIDPASNSFDAGNDEIRHDAENPETPHTVFGAIIAALQRRRATGVGPLTLQSCDNLQGNGDILREAVVTLAGLSDPELADWIDTECTFPNSMVDRIVPATGDRELALAHEIGIDDAVPVTHESFCQWVVEDKYCAGRPAWDRVGVTFSDRVRDYEEMKIRILNGGHQILANPGEILAVETIADCMAHPLIGSLFRKVAREEIIAHVNPVPDTAPEAYVDLVDRRFSNPMIVDTPRRVAFDGSSRHTGFILPVLREALGCAAPSDGLALAEALWCRMCAGTREDGTVIKPNDPFWPQLHNAACAARLDPLAWLDQGHLYGDLGGNRTFAAAFSKWLKLIWESGTETAMQAYIGSRQKA